MPYRGVAGHNKCQAMDSMERVVVERLHSEDSSSLDSLDSNCRSVGTTWQHSCQCWLIVGGDDAAPTSRDNDTITVQESAPSGNIS